MSTLSATNLKNASSASNNIVLGTSGQTTVNGDLQFNSGYGSAATAYGCRAWVNFNGQGTTATNQTIRASGNVTSVYKNGTADYTVNFTTAMPDADYCVTGSMGSFTATQVARSVAIASAAAPTTSAVRIVNIGSGVAEDTNRVSVAIFR